jgi:hypothetical protein
MRDAATVVSVIALLRQLGAFRQPDGTIGQSPRRPAVRPLSAWVNPRPEPLWLGREERRAAEASSAALARKAANYQAWQVINSAQGKGGSGGRVDALADLIANDVSLAGVKLDGAWLEKARLDGAMLREASFEGTNLTGASFHRANLADANFSRATLVGADLRQASLRGALLREAFLSTADLRGADLQGLQGWETIASYTYTNIEGVKNPPPGFREHALERGAIDGDNPLEAQTARSFSTEWRAV